MQTEKEQNSSSPVPGLAQVVQAAPDWCLVELIMQRGSTLSGICSLPIKHNTIKKVVKDWNENV